MFTLLITFIINSISTIRQERFRAGLEMSQPHLQEAQQDVMAQRLEWLRQVGVPGEQLLRVPEMVCSAVRSD
jgi:hypothetical protein